MADSLGNKSGIEGEIPLALPSSSLPLFAYKGIHFGFSFTVGIIV